MIDSHGWDKIVKQYCDDVLSGHRLANRYEIAAVKRYLSDRKRGKFLFDLMAAECVCQFISLLTMSSGEYAGKQFDLKGWQAFILFNLFGFKHPKTKYRRFRDAFISVGRGNGKSVLLAAILLYLFAFDDPVEPQAEVYTVATKRDQAKIVFEEVKRFILNDKVLSSMFHLQKCNVFLPSNYSKFEPLSSDAKSMDGLRIHGLGRDELHAWTEFYRDTYEKLETALGKRRQPLAITVTTAGNEESDIWREQFDFAVDVIEPDSPIESDDMFVYICQIDLADEPLDETVWTKANPMLAEGIVKIDHLRRLAAKAKASPIGVQQFKRYHCNAFTTSYNKCITPQLWANGAATLPADDILKELPCFIGFDWGWRRDLTAMAYVFELPCEDEELSQYRKTYAVKCDVWIPRHGFRDLNREPWASWIEDGYLIATDGDSTDVDAIYRTLQQRIDQYWIQSVAFDGANAREFGTRVENEYGIPAVTVAQSCPRLHEPTQELLLALNEKRLIHGNNPLLAWCAYNVVLRENSQGYVMPYKQKSVDKIDPIMAIIMALSESLLHAQQHVYYEENDIEVV